MYVYFIQAGGNDGPIKIGIASDPDERLGNMQIGNHEELFMLAVVPGTVAMERDLHDRFAAGRIRGEWFAADTPGLRAEIRRAVQLEAEMVMSDRGPCRQCGVRPIPPPRTRVCSATCERERKRQRSIEWRRAARSS